MKLKTRIASLAALALLAIPAQAELSPEQLAKLSQNPVGNLVSVPFQNNTNFAYGPQNGTQDILNIQPVIPFSLDRDWNVITRTIIPAIWLPSLFPGDSNTSGIGHIFHFGRLPVNMQIGAYYNVVKPDNGPNWQLRAQVQFMFPK